MDFTQINWLASAVAAFIAFVLGGLWYGPVFGKQWQALAGVTDEMIANGMADTSGPKNRPPPAV